MSRKVDWEVRRFIREMKLAPICEPGPNEIVGDCPYSKTGWAIYASGSIKGYCCTCRPALAPDSGSLSVSVDAD
jgi:hypothetical protein